MTTHIDIEGAAREARRLRGNLARLVAGAPHDFAQRGGDWAKDARRAGNRAWTIAERDAGQMIGKIENNPLAVASAALTMGALVGLYFLFQGSLFRRTQRLARAPVKRGFARVEQRTERHAREDGAGRAQHAEEMSSHALSKLRVSTPRPAAGEQK